jgi:hypothetical protein
VTKVFLFLFLFFFFFFFWCLSNPRPQDPPMLLLPDHVSFGPHTLDDVLWLAVDRAAERTALEWSDDGPHAVFADVPEQRVTLRLTRLIVGQAPSSVVPGERHTLAAEFAATAASARRRLTVSAVVTGVEYQLTGPSAAAGSARATRQHITLVALSPDGVADPVAIQDL